MYLSTYRRSFFIGESGFDGLDGAGGDDDVVVGVADGAPREEVLLPHRHVEVAEHLLDLEAIGGLSSILKDSIYLTKQTLTHYGLSILTSLHF